MGILATSHRGGFTLLELIIVVVVTLVLVDMAVPMISGTLRDLSLDTTSREFVADLRRARVEAMRTNSAVTVKVEAGSSAYRIDGVGARILSNDVTFSADGADSVRFASFGPTLSGPATFVLTLGGLGKKVVVLASGMPTVE